MRSMHPLPCSDHLCKTATRIMGVFMWSLCESGTCIVVFNLIVAIFLSLRIEAILVGIALVLLGLEIIFSIAAIFTFKR